MRGLFSRASVSNSDTGDQYSGPITNSNDANVSYTDQRALQHTAVWSCMRLITETVGSLPLPLYRYTADGRESVDDHYLARIFWESPNPMMTPLEFREALTAQVVGWGNGYAFIQWSGRPFDSEVISLVPLRAELMVPVRLGNTVSYHYHTERGVQVFAKESIFHIKGWGTDGLVGLSPIGYAAQTLGVSLSADKYAAKAFSSGGRPVGVLKFDAFLNAEQRKQAREVHRNISADDADGTWVLEGGSDYKPVVFNPSELQVIESRQFQLAEIARIFRVPSYLINDHEKSTSWGTGIEQQNLGFLTYTIRPYLTRWEAAISGSLLNRTDRKKYFMEHNVEGLLRADSAGRASYLSQMVQNGLMSRNEGRKKENLPPKVGGDELTVQVNLTPLDQLIKATSNAGIQNQPD